MRTILAILGLLTAAVLVAYIASAAVVGVDPYKLADCPDCGRRAVFHGPDRDVRPEADWAWFDCDGCGARFMVRDGEGVLLLDNAATEPAVLVAGEPETVTGSEQLLTDNSSGQLSESDSSEWHVTEFHYETPEITVYGWQAASGGKSTLQNAPESTRRGRSDP